MLAYYLHNLDPIIFRIYDNVGPRWYGLSYVLAFICGYLLFLWLAKRGYADLAPQRVANFINGELYGRMTKVPWAVQFPKELFDHPQEAERAVAACARIDPSLATPDAIVGAVRSQPEVATALRSILSPRHPSQLYEAFFEGVVLFAILWFVRTRRREPNGVLTGLFFIWYAIFRIIIEYFREPDATLVGPFTRGQFFSFFLIAIGLGFVAVAKMRPTFPKNILAKSG